MSGFLFSALWPALLHSRGGSLPAGLDNLALGFGSADRVGRHWQGKRELESPSFYPRVRRNPGPLWHYEGLSPRVRAHPGLGCLQGVSERAIPACAGSPTPAIETLKEAPVHPRLCGLTEGIASESRRRRGPFPRVRAHRRRPFRQHTSPRSIPACAGSPTPQLTVVQCAPVHPRVCGLTPQRACLWQFLRGPSPRVRAHPDGARVLSPLDRSIPACAGSPIVPWVGCVSDAVHPRVCGLTCGVVSL